MIRYKIYQNQQKKGLNAGKWFARAVSDETFDLAKLAEHMSKHNSPYSSGVIKGVLTDMVDCIKELLLDGKSVKIDDLAIFGVGIRSKAAGTLELSASTITASAGMVNITGGGGDVVVSGKSLVNHTHTGNLGNQTSPPT